MMKLLYSNLFLLSLVPQLAFSVPTKNSKETQDVMRKIFAEMTNILPLSLNDEEFFDAKNSKRIEGSFARMAGLTDEFIKVTNSRRDIAFRGIRDDFIVITKTANSAFRLGNKAKAQSLVHYQVEFCVSCHTQRSAPSDSSLTLDFMGELQNQEYDPIEKARLLTLVRRFDDAMKHYEDILSSRSISTEQKVLSNTFLDYLVLGIRVKDDPARVRAFLAERLNKKEPEVVRKAYQDTIEAIDQIGAMKGPRHFQFARQLIEDGYKNRDYPRDRKSMVHYLLASRIIRQELNRQKNLSKADQAHHSLLLGQAELMIDGYDFGAMRYFESAIRQFPHSEVAGKAFDLYHENLSLGFTGSSGTHIPEEEVKVLEELKALAKKAKQ